MCILEKKEKRHPTTPVMDRLDWTMRLRDDEWSHWRPLYEAAESVDHGMYTVWGLNLLLDLCEACGCPANPQRMPRDSREIRLAMDKLQAGKTAQVQSRSIRVLRHVLGACDSTKFLLSFLPRYRREAEVNPITRQRRCILEDSLPKNIEQQWIRVLLQEILEHEASSHWKTSKTANQTLSMIHKFLRASGLLMSASLEDFHVRVSGMSLDVVRAICAEFTDKFCASAASARRYIVVFNHLFHRIWRLTPDKITIMPRKRKVVSITDLDERLSQSTRNSVNSKTRAERGCLDYFNEVELKRIREAAAQGPTQIRDILIIDLLETTGLRRMGLLNLLVREVAERGDDSGRWVSLSLGRTLTKGARWHQFKMFQSVRKHLEDWLNMAEADGGRPEGPSPFVFPSGKIDNNQMSATALTKIFKNVCTRAGFGGDQRAHLHAMRHSCAHLLSAKGNSTKQISLVLGHRSVTITDSVYLRDNVESGCSNMVLPTHWQLDSTVSETNMNQKRMVVGDANQVVVPTKSTKNKVDTHRTSTRELAMRAVQLLEAQNAPR